MKNIEEKERLKKIEYLYTRVYKIINRLILYSKRFCENLATPDGLIEYLNCLDRGRGSRASKYTYIYEFDYFVMTKSTKTLKAIRKLLNNNNLPMNEDVLILVRSLLENYIMSQYIRTSIRSKDVEKMEKAIVDFIMNPYEMAMGHAKKGKLKGKYVIINDKDEFLGQLVSGPSKYVGESEQTYFRPLYDFLCKYSHCSFDIMYCYFESENMSFSTEKVNGPFWALICTLFVFTKLYENIVLAKGEDIENIKGHFDVFYDSLELQLEMLKEHIEIFKEGYRDIDREFLSLIIEKGAKDNFAHERIALAKAMEEDIKYGTTSDISKCYDEKKCKFIRNYKHK
ncbi:DUF5677 domain-containing protein [Lacrimispora xylanolytica]|uniref:DUF5677 domain-containing protein n=1 Tax=Lacrimispora xylanolytica TaxID=29375 RepID=A0ABY7A9A8_9FIRM|nr:DUF5677 domain-containing protein [Lacrimispora xylanolytica]WAJ22338.1 DUF5677 domain-containing protein [Lacrimispora xylanolytica]